MPSPLAPGSRFAGCAPLSGDGEGPNRLRGQRRRFQRRKFIEKIESDTITQRLLGSGMLVGLVDAASEGNEFTDKTGGLGIARKTGMDLA